jgi:hypothetical protein
METLSSTERCEFALVRSQNLTVLQQIFGEFRRWCGIHYAQAAKLARRGYQLGNS